MPMREAHVRVADQPPREDLNDGRPGSPGDMEAGHRIAMPLRAVTAALGPAHQWENLQTPGPQPAALLPRREIDIGVRPLPRPVVFLAVERRGAQPILQRQFVTVVHTQPALLRTVDEEQTAERPERLPAEVGAVLLVDDQDSLA